jgi:PKD repeat protein
MNISLRKSQLSTSFLKCCFLSIILSATAAFAQVSFNVDKTNGCRPLTVTFSNTSSIGNYYKWHFGTGDSSSVKNPVYTFKKTGNYWVRLDAYDTTGKTMVYKGTNNQGPSINVTGNQMQTSADSACPGEIVSAYLMPGGGQCNWDFGDGFSSTQQNVTHAYSSPNTYTIKCVYFNSTCSQNDTLTQKVVIVAGAKPSAKFNTNNSISCPNDPISFYPRNLNASTYSWAFGDAATSSQSQPAHAYSSTGNYAVTLTVTSSCGQTSTYKDSVRIKSTVHFNSGLAINTSIAKACPGDKVGFSFNNTIAPVSQMWKFGNGDSSAAFNPQYTYTTAGTYIVTVKIKNSCSLDTTLSHSITIGGNSRWSGNIDYKVSPSAICPGDKMNYSVYTSAKAYSWNFGDASTSTAANGQHSYSTKNTYTVSLTLTNNCNIDTTVYTTIYVTDTLKPYVTSIGNNNNWAPISENACKGDTISFFAKDGSHYIFDFGDGTSTTQTRPFNIPGFGTIDLVKHAYTSTGLFKVIITYFNGCNKSAKDSTEVNITTGLQVIGGIQNLGSNFSVCAPVPFIAAGGNNFQWNFGDGNTLNTSQVGITHTYALPGSYNVSVKITNACGNSSIYTQLVTVQAMNITALPTSTSCNGGADGTLSLVVSNGTAPYSYSFNGGAYQGSALMNGLAAGTYSVAVKDANGCISNIAALVSQPNAISTTGSSTAAACGNNTGSASVSVSGGASPYTYSWNTGATTATASALVAGVYTVAVVDAKGCTKTTAVSVSNSTGPVVTPGAVTSASCNGTCNGSASVSASGTGTLSYSWSNGFTGTTTSNNLCAGTYAVAVKDGNNCITAVNITVTEPAAIAIAPAKTDVYCFGGNTGSAAVTITGGTSPYVYSWSAGSSGATQTTLAAAIYTVTVTDINLCSKTTTVSISQPASALGVSISSIKGVTCKGNDGSVAATANGGTPLYTYTWSMSKVGSTVNGLSTGAFTVTVTDAKGCTSITNGSVTLAPLFKPTISANVNQLTASPGVTYQWYRNGSLISGGTSQVYNATLTGDYTVTETDANGCTGTSAITTITITATINNVDQTGIDVYPNPTNGSLNVIINGNKNESMNISIADITGKLIYAELVNVIAGKNLYAIDLAKYKVGIYTLRAVSGESLITKKIIVQ